MARHDHWDSPQLVSRNNRPRGSTTFSTESTCWRISCYWMIAVAIICVQMSQVTASLPFDAEPEDYELCSGPPSIGPCKASLPKWYFDRETKNCTSFIWGGCDGNQANRFDSEADCLHTCTGAPHTLPPNSSSTENPLNKQPVTPSKSLVPRSSNSKTPVPHDQRGKELTFEESGYEKTFKFAQSNTFIQMDGEYIQTFQLRICREISFQFRTRLPHGLLVYHNVKTQEDLHMEPYALYVIVEKGQLKVVHVYGKHSTSVTVGEALNRDEWHSVMVRIDVHGARLIAKVDNQEEEVYLNGLNHDTNYGVFTNLTSVVLVGGLSSEEKLHGVKYIIESFVGCIKDVVLSSGKSASDLIPITPLIATKHENVQEGCQDICHTINNLCFFGAKCINHYNRLSCDCFGMNYEGELCDHYTATILTLRGSSYVSYRVYDWKDRVHSPVNIISMHFKTDYDDSALFYASGESLKHQYIAVSIKNQSIYVEMDFGDGVISTNIGQRVNVNYWHNFTIFHNYTQVIVTLDVEKKVFDIPGTLKMLYIDPEIYIGGGPDLEKKKGLASHNHFPGSLKYVYFNGINILYQLKKSNPKVQYIGVLEPEFFDADVEVIPITYPFAASHIRWPMSKTEGLDLKFDFKSSQNIAVLAYGEVETVTGKGYWEVRMVQEELRFELVPESSNNVTTMTSVKFDPLRIWHHVEVLYKDDEIKLAIDTKNKQTPMFGLKFIPGDKVIIGSGLKSPSQGLVGCMRDIFINGDEIEPRYVVKTERVVGEVALDNCQFVDPCTRPNTCEHNGKCSVKDDKIFCDCKDTGYIGRNCHFTKYRKTCEELALLGYTKPDVYLIDIDGNGRFPPAHVKCEFQSLEDATKTIVEHNLPSQVDVRSATESDFSYEIKYREFSAEMLQELISHSLYCSQSIKYDCYKAPLDLYSYSWFTASDKNKTVDFLGKSGRGSCPCGMTRTCEDPTQTCNCDSLEDKWLSDEGTYVEPASLGITGMVFLQQKDLEEDAQGRLTLGSLECVETNTQKYVVTFTTSQSYIEVPGWRKGDIAFSFRTTGEKAILLYQPPIRPNYPSFQVALTSDYQLTFNFTLNTGIERGLVITSNKKLNGGEWHKIWIDYNEYHVRFMINTDYKMVDLEAEEKFGPFEGSMFIGGATSDHLKKSTVTSGLIGCFRGLVVNGEILDIYSYMSVHLSEIIKDCKPSCDPSPCKNGAQCRELWSTFQCVCSNPWAHVGPLCETNINKKALTFITPESYLKKNYLLNSTDEKTIMKHMMQKNLLVNLRTYDEHSLVLYANDHYNNFVHLYITNGTQLVYLYNYGPEIINLTIEYPELSSGHSVQVAVVRSENLTVLHVNEKNISVPYGVQLLDEYSNKPWTNPEEEVLSPHRPPAPPTDYFQINLGGYDTQNLLRANLEIPVLQGYVGCIRGLKIGDHLVDLPERAKENIVKDMTGVLPDCQMKCDLDPCKNGGICTEDFAKQESSCNCEHTSYFGEFCMEEKGADFSGDSVLQRKYVLSGPVNSVKIQLAFSSSYMTQRNTVMILLQTENRRSYYLMVGLTDEGALKFEEDREGEVFGATINDRNFLNGARHSVYYKRVEDDAVLLIDRIEVPLNVIQKVNFQELPDIGANELQIGGINTTDPRFAQYKSYSGCLSNLFLEVNDYSMKPLEEYMLFTKSGSDNITVTNSQGVRSAQCNAEFDIIQIVPAGPSLNLSLGVNKAWVEDPPEKVPYISSYPEPSKKEDKTQVVFIVLTSLFVIIIVCVTIEVIRTNYQYKKRIERETDEGIIWSKEQATKLHESPGIGVQPFAYKAVPTEEPKKPPTSNGTVPPKVEDKPNGTAPPETNGKTPVATEEKPIETVAEVNPDAEKKEFLGGIRESQLMDHELQWDTLGEATDLNGTDSIHSEDENIADLPVPTAIEMSRPRQKQISWGPPKVGMRRTQLPYKIDEITSA